MCLCFCSPDTQALKAVVGEEALSAEEKRFLEFEQNFEKKFLAQDPYDVRAHAHREHSRVG